MDEREFKAALKQTKTQPPFDTLIRRFQFALAASNGSTETAMAAVNELLEEPIAYDVFVERMRSDA